MSFQETKMAKEETSKTEDNRKKKDYRVKIVVRRLPPALLEDEFNELTKPWIERTSSVWF